MITLHRHALSGHCHRVELLLSLLKLDYETIDVDLEGGEHKRAEFIALNPFGRVPVLEDDDIVITESNAILVYLARKYGSEIWFPQLPVRASEVQRWLSIAASDIAEGPAAARLVTVFGADLDLEARQTRAHCLLEIMEQHLSGRRFLAAPHPTLADVAAYAYIAHAPEGGVDLGRYGAVRAWLARVEALDGFVGMRPTQVRRRNATPQTPAGAQVGRL